jgi:hypothetical protein
MSHSTYAGHGWTISITHHQIRVVSMAPTEPDPKWSYVDKQFHGHRYVEDFKAKSAGVLSHYPTLRYRDPGDLDDEDSEVWTACALCGEVITPGRRSVDPVSYVDGPTEAILTLDLPLDPAATSALMAAVNEDNQDRPLRDPGRGSPPAPERPHDPCGQSRESEGVMTNPHSTPAAHDAAQHEILRTVVGSTVHGTAVDGQDDLDLMGICIEPPEYVVGLRRFDQYISRTQPEGVRSGPGDVDLVVYSARKWCRLALGGNPTVLLPLFVAEEHVVHVTPAGRELRNMAYAFASKRAGRAFLGYMTQQRERLLGVRGGRHTNRPELVEKYGYDTKYAAHMIRLGLQGVEFMSTGRIQLPANAETRATLIAVRTGQMGYDDVLAMAADLERQVVRLLDTSSLPARANEKVVEAWLLAVYPEVWYLTA